MMQRKIKVSVVIPAYNEEGNIKIVSDQVIKNIPEGFDYELIFINDGSQDRTLEILKELNAFNPAIRYLSFSRNFGHQQALKAGIDYATGDCIISMDADLQHPPRLIPVMLEKWIQGFDIVYTQREQVKSLSLFKRKTSGLFYKLMNTISDINIEEGTADFRLLDKSVADILRNSQDRNLFLRGFITWVGFKQYKLKYIPDDRFSGTTKYSFKKMALLALDGITSFSIKPLHFSTMLGAVISLFSFLYALYAIYIFLFTENAISGWASVLVSVLFIGGIQLLILGIIGEYLGKIFIQSKGRPSYIIREHDQHERTIPDRQK